MMQPWMIHTTAKCQVFCVRKGETMCWFGMPHTIFFQTQKIACIKSGYMRLLNFKGQGHLQVFMIYKAWCTYRMSWARSRCWHDAKWRRCQSSMVWTWQQRRLVEGWCSMLKVWILLHHPHIHLTCSEATNLIPIQADPSKQGRGIGSAALLCTVPIASFPGHSCEKKCGSGPGNEATL